MFECFKNSGFSHAYTFRRLVRAASVAALLSWSCLFGTRNCVALFGAQSEPPAPNVVTNSLGMRFVLIPAGEFMMGNKESPQELARAFAAYYAEPGFFVRGNPSHRVRLSKPIYMGVHEVTRGQFRQFVEKTDYKTDAETVFPRGVVTVTFSRGQTGFDLSPDATWRNVGFEQTDEHPVVGVSWNDAVAFCKWLSTKEGKTYRLPTESEWEYACRAGDDGNYGMGVTAEELVKVGNVADRTAAGNYPDWDDVIPSTDGYVYTAPVGRFRPNGFGLYDMRGNASEWCADWYRNGYYSRPSPAIDPAGPDSGNGRVLRGGSWSSRPYSVRSSARENAASTDRSQTDGFRILRTD